MIKTKGLRQKNMLTGLADTESSVSADFTIWELLQLSINAQVYNFSDFDAKISNIVNHALLHQKTVLSHFYPSQLLNTKTSKFKTTVKNSRLTWFFIFFYT